MNAIRSWLTVPVLAVVLSVLLACVAVAGYALAESAAMAPDRSRVAVSVPEGDPLRVTFLGDSLTVGLHASEPRSGFSQRMVQAWRADGAVLDNPRDSLVGGTVADALRNPNLPSDQHLYVVELGTNDVVRTDHGTFRSDYEQLLDRIRVASPDAGLLCVGLWRPTDVASRFDTIIADLCEARGGAFRSLSGVRADPGFLGPAGEDTYFGPSDDFHPNDHGHREIAARLLGAVSMSRAG